MGDDHSQAPSFNVSFDERFADLVKQKSLISQDSTLATLKPSSLNFSQNCWTTCDLLSISQSKNSQNDPNFIPIVANDVGALLSSPPDDAPAMDYMEFWTGLQQLNETAQVFDSACTWCNTSGHLDASGLNFDFRADCSQTGAFYSHYFGSSDFGMTYADIVPFFRASLAVPYRNMTSATIEAVAVGTWNLSNPAGQRSSSALPLASPYGNSVLQAAAYCAKDACRNLDYTGNTDLGGIGSLATYFMIAAITTVFAMLSIHYKKHRDFEWEFRNALRNNIISTSVMFWDAITWLAILTLIAAFVERLVTPPTLYEAVLTQWVVYIMINSVGALWALEAYHETPRAKASTPQHLARMIITLCTCVVAGMSFNAAVTPHDWTQKVDSACYADFLWPLYRAWRVATWFQAFIPVLWGVSLFLKLLTRPSKRHVGGRLRGRLMFASNDAAESFRMWLSYGSAILSLCVLWFDVICIYMFREDARDYFGESYDDDSFGYGQMLAAGFAAQPVVNFFFNLMSDTFDTPTIQFIWTASQQLLQRRLQLLNTERQRGLDYKNLEDKSTPDIPTVPFMEVTSGRLDLPESWPLADYALPGKASKTAVEVEERHIRDE